MSVKQDLEYQPKNYGLTVFFLSGFPLRPVFSHQIPGTKKLPVVKRVNKAGGLEHLPRSIGIVKPEGDGAPALSGPQMYQETFCLPVRSFKDA